MEPEKPGPSESGVVQAFKPSHHFTHSPKGPSSGKDFVVFETTLHVSQLGERHHLDGKRPPKQAFGVHSTIWSDFFIGQFDPVGPLLVNMLN